MRTITAFIRRHAVLTYSALVFAISWGGVLIVVGPRGIPGTADQFKALLPLAVLAMVAGPSAAGLLMTGLVHGTAGLRDFRTRLLRWRLAARWYAVALLTAPLLMMAVLLALSRFSDRFLPGIFVSDGKVALLVTAMAIALTAGVVEELGWTGFAVPAIRRGHGVLATGLIVGFLWAAWHLLVALWASGTVSGTLFLASYLLDPFLFLVAFRVLMVWVYDRTDSLLVAMLMHMSLTFSPRVLAPLGTSAVHLLTFDLVWSAAVSVVVVAVAVVNGWHLTRQPLRTRAA
jgi:membrane protease YdiL (CAAX protease family)